MYRSTQACLAALTMLVGCNGILGLDESTLITADAARGGSDAPRDASAEQGAAAGDPYTSAFPSGKGTAGSRNTTSSNDTSVAAAGTVSHDASDSRGGASADAAGTGGARDSVDGAGDAAAGGPNGASVGGGGAGGGGAGGGGAKTGTGGLGAGGAKAGTGGLGAGGASAATGGAATGGVGAGGASAGTGGASTGGQGGQAGTDGCFEHRSSCSGDLSNLGTGDFEIAFTLTTSATHRTEILDQREICGHSHFWDVEMVDGALLFETDDGANYTACLGSTPVNDGKAHRVVARRTNERLEISVDCALDAACASHADFSTVLPALRTTSPCSGNPDPPIGLVGTLLDVCVAGR